MADFQNDTLNRGQPESEACTVGDFGCYFDWLIDQLASLVLWVWDKILSGLASIIEAIPVPDWAANIGTLQLPEVVAWALAPFQLQTGVAIIMSAYALRFVIRRLPVVG